MQTYQCPKCDAEWVPRIDEPKQCPRCKFRLHTFGKELKRMLQKKEMVTAEKKSG